MHLATYTLLLIVFAVATWIRPAYVAAAVWCMFALDQLGQISHPYLLTHSTFTNLAVGLLILLALVRSGFQAGFSSMFALENNRLQVMVIALFCYAFASSFWSAQETFAMHRWSSAGLYVFTILLLLPGALRSTEDFQRAIIFFLLTGTVLGVVLTFFTSWEYRALFIEGGGQAVGLPLALGEFGAMLFMMAILVDGRGSRVLAWIRILAAVTGAVLVVKSGTRGAFIAMLATVVVFAPGAWKLKGLKNPVLISLSLLAAIAVAFVALNLFMGGSNRWQTGELESDFGGRTLMAATLLQEWASHGFATLVFGLGNSASYGILGIYPHIVPAELLGEEGLVGLGLFIAIVVFSTLLVRRNLGSAVGRILGACCCMYYLLALKQGSLLSPFLFMFPILLEAHARMISLRTPPGTGPGALPRMSPPPIRWL